MNGSIKFATHPATSDLVLLAIFGAIGSVFLGVIGTSFWIIAIYIAWATGLAWIWLFLTSMIAVGLVALGLRHMTPRCGRPRGGLPPCLATTIAASVALPADAATVGFATATSYPPVQTKFLFQAYPLPRNM